MYTCIYHFLICMCIYIHNNMNKFIMLVNFRVIMRWSYPGKKKTTEKTSFDHGASQIPCRVADVLAHKKQVLQPTKVFKNDLVHSSPSLKHSMSISSWNLDMWGHIYIGSIFSIYFPASNVGDFLVLTTRFQSYKQFASRPTNEAERHPLGAGVVRTGRNVTDIIIYLLSILCTYIYMWIYAYAYVYIYTCR